MSRRFLGVEEQRRRRHRILIYIILGTLPCYFCGIVLLVGFSGNGGPAATPTEAQVVATETPTEALTTTVTRTPTVTPGGPTLTLAATPTQFRPPTTSPTPTRTGTPDLDATATIRALLTQGANSLTATAVAPTQRAQATGTAQVEATATARANATATAGAGANATATANANATATANARATAAANRPPNASDDSATTDQGQAVNINVLQNDSDPDGNTLTIADYNRTSAQGGTVQCENGVCRYTPPAGFSGSDRFSYTVSDGRGGTDTATVTITVNPPPNRAPTAQDDTATTTRNTPVEINVLQNDSDPDGDTLTIVELDNTSEEEGDVLCSNGICTYTPPEGFTGEDSFEYTIGDGRGGRDTATVTVTVNAP